MSARLSRLALLLILVIAAGRVVSTWFVFNQTVDEGTHISLGLEWLQRGTYLGEPLHPPLARVASALGPYAAGARLTVAEEVMIDQSKEFLYSGTYLKMLALARAGILPFFLLSIVAVWWHARDLGGEVAAILAALLYSNVPVALAHAGVATTDMAVTAGIAATLMLLHRWLRAPALPTAALLGLAAAVAVASKLSSLLFLPVAGLFYVVTTALSAELRSRHLWRRTVRHGAVALLLCFVAVWAVYRFRFEPLRGITLDLVTGYVQTKPLLQPLAAHLGAVPLPMPELLAGVAQMLSHDAEGHQSFFFGERGARGWWHFFPVAIGLKTTIPFLLLAIASGAVLAFRARKTGEWSLLAPWLGAVAIVSACMPSSINIGIRHVLPVFPLLAVSAACALASVWKRGRAGRTLVAVMLVAEVFVSVRAHPDYLAYFNAFAGDAPHEIFVDSNLDWGQDLLRLERRARELKIEALCLFYFGSADAERHDLPPLLPLVSDQPPPGWFAVSETAVAHYPEVFPWLSRFPQYERVGKSIRLYRLPGEPKRDDVLAVLSRILVPLPLGSSGASDGRTWTTALRLTSNASAPEVIRDQSGNRRDLAPGQSLLWDAPSSDTPWFLYVRRAAAARITAQMVASGVSVPAPSESEFRSWARLRLPPCGGCTRTLRVYSLHSGPLVAGITLRRDGQTLEHSATLSAATGLPAFGQFDLKQVFGGASDGEVTIVAGRHEPVWALVSSGSSVITSE
jgi:hypothetical protein